jgi:hypothetical protein
MKMAFHARLTHTRSIKIKKKVFEEWRSNFTPAEMRKYTGAGTVSFEEDVTKEHIVVSLKMIDESVDVPAPAIPPATAHFLLRLVVASKSQEDVLGWIEERYRLDVQKFGPRRAKQLFWSQTLRSIGPLVWEKVRNWGIFTALVEYGRRKIGW